MTNIAGERKLLAAQGLDMITREQWDAVQSYTSDREVFTPVEGFVLHISVTIDGGNTGLTEADDMRDIEAIGQQRFGIGFPYNAAVFDTGRLYEGQPLSRRGAHTVDDKGIGYKSPMNKWFRAIVLPQMVTDDVTKAQVQQCARWAAAQIRAGYAKRNAIWIGHRDVAFKSCPGDAGYAQLGNIRKLTEQYVRNGLGDDMLTQAEHNAVMATETRSTAMYKALRGDEDADQALVEGIRTHVRAVVDEASTDHGSELRAMVMEKAGDALAQYGVAKEPPTEG